MPTDNTSEKPSTIIPTQISDFLSVVVLGGVVGVIIWAIAMMLNRFVFDVYLCQNVVSGQCTTAENYSVVAASIVGAIAALVALIRLRVYRPLLVLIASLVSLWGIVQLSWDLGWFTGILVVFLLYALAFGLYAWVARIRQFWIALIVIVVLVVAVRLALVS